MDTYKNRAAKIAVGTLCLLIFAICCNVNVASAYELGPTAHRDNDGNLLGTGGKWGNSAHGTSGGTVTWAFMSSEVPSGSIGEPGATYYDLDEFMFDGYESVIRTAFYTWSQVADIQFVEGTDGGEPYGSIGPIDIRIGGHDSDHFDSPGALAHANYPGANLGGAGDIHFNTDVDWTHTDSGSAYNLYRVAVHEIGHAIGLGHVDDANAVMYDYYNESIPLGLMADDIAGAVHLYGVAGGPVYTPPIAEENNVVPEPGTMVLVGIGVIGLFGYGWRKKVRMAIK